MEDPDGYCTCPEVSRCNGQILGSTPPHLSPPLLLKLSKTSCIFTMSILDTPTPLWMHALGCQ